MTLRLSLWLCLILLPVQAFAQATVSGVARDPGGAVLPGVQVQLSRVTGDASARTTVTDRDGRYEFRDVAVGTYSMTFMLPGFGTLTREGIAVIAGRPQIVDATLRVAPIPETIQIPPPRRFPPFGPERRNCLHGEAETSEQRERREEALAAMRLFDRVVRTFSGARSQSPSWQEVSNASLVRRLIAQGDDLASRIRWGSNEPLPGWGLAWVVSTTGNRSRFELTDLRDACAFTYSSEDPDVIPRFQTQPL